MTSQQSIKFEDFFPEFAAKPATAKPPTELKYEDIFADESESQYAVGDKYIADIKDKFRAGFSFNQLDSQAQNFLRSDEALSIYVRPESQAVYNQLRNRVLSKQQSGQFDIFGMQSSEGRNITSIGEIDEAIDFVKGVGQGTVDMIALAPAGLGVITNAVLQDLPGLFGDSAIARNGALVGNAIQQWTAGLSKQVQEYYEPILQRDLFANQLAEFNNNISNPRSWSMQLSKGLGNAIGFLGTAMVTGTLGTTARIAGTVAAGSGLAAEGIYNDVRSRLSQDPTLTEKQIDETARRYATIGGGISGMFEAIGLESVLRVFPGGRKQANDFLTGVLFAAAGEGLTENLQTSLERSISQFADPTINDEDKANIFLNTFRQMLSDESLMAGGVGAVIGGGIAGGAGTAGAAIRRRDDRVAAADYMVGQVQQEETAVATPETVPDSVPTQVEQVVQEDPADPDDDPVLVVADGEVVGSFPTGSSEIADISPETQADQDVDSPENILFDSAFAQAEELAATIPDAEVVLQSEFDEQQPQAEQPDPEFAAEVEETFDIPEVDAPTTAALSPQEVLNRVAPVEEGVEQPTRILSNREASPFSRRLRAGARKIGIDVVLINDTGQDFTGFLDPTNEKRVFVVEPDTQSPQRARKQVASVFGHEIFHSLEATDPELVRALVATVPRGLQQSINEYYATSLGQRAITQTPRSKQVSEGLALLIENSLAQLGTGSLFNQDAGLVKRFVDFIRRTIVKMNLRGQFKRQVLSLVEQMAGGRKIDELTLSPQVMARGERAREAVLESVREPVPEDSEEAPAQFAARRVPKVNYRTANAGEIIAAHTANKRQSFLSPKDPDDLQSDIDRGQVIAVISNDGTSGYLLDRNDPDDISLGYDIQGVFNIGPVKGAGQAALADAISRGGRTLDAYDGYLPALYSSFGFVETHRAPYNEEFASAEFGPMEGRPDVVLMTYVREETDAEQIIAAKSEPTTAAPGPYNIAKDGSNWPDYATRVAGLLRAPVSEQPADGRDVRATGEDTRRLLEEEVRFAAKRNQKQVASRRLAMSDAREVIPTGGKGKKKTVTVKDAAIAIVRPRTDYKDEKQFNAAVDRAVRMVELQLDQEQSGLGWYNKDIVSAFLETSKVYPEIADPKRHTEKQVFLSITAILSNGQQAPINWQDAAYAYGEYKKTGRIPRRRAAGTIFGTRGNTIAQQFSALEHMFDVMGEARTAIWLTSQKTVDEMRSIRRAAAKDPRLADSSFKNNAMYKDTQTMGIAGRKTVTKYGAYVFGPKIGPFFLNLNGIDETTIDVWAMRTFGREFGILLDNPSKETGVHDAPTAIERPYAKRFFEEIGKRLGIKEQDAQAVAWFAEKELYLAAGVRSAKTWYFSDGARRFVKSPSGQSSVRAAAPTVGAGSSIRFAARKDDSSKLRQRLKIEEFTSNYEFDSSTGASNLNPDTLKKRIHANVGIGLRNTDEAKRLRMAQKLKNLANSEGWRAAVREMATLALKEQVVITKRTERERSAEALEREQQRSADAIAREKERSKDRVERAKVRERKKQKDIASRKLEKLRERIQMMRSFMEEVLPPRVRGRYLGLLTNIKTDRGLETALNRIALAAAKDEWKSEVRRFKKVASTAAKAIQRLPKVSQEDIPSAQEISAAVVKARGKALQAGNQRAKVFPDIETNVANTIELNNLVNEIKEMIQTARQDRDIRLAERRLGLAEVQVEINEDVEASKDPLDIEIKSKSGKAKANAANAQLRTSMGKRFALAHQTMATVVRRITNDPAGEKLLFKLLIERVRRADSAMNLFNYQIMQSLEKLAQTAGFADLETLAAELDGVRGLKRSELIEVTLGGQQTLLLPGEILHLHLMDPDTRISIAEGSPLQIARSDGAIDFTNVTIEELNAAAANLDPKIIEFGEQLKHILETEFRPKMMQVLRDMKGFEPKTVFNYFPLVRSSRSSETELMKQVLDGNASVMALAAGFVQNSSMTKERVKNRAPIMVMPALQLWQDHVETVSRIIHMAEISSDSFKVINGEDFKRKVTQRYGDSVHKSLKNYALELVTGDIKDPKRGGFGFIGRALRSGTRNISGSFIMGNPGTWIIQYTGVPRLLSVFSFNDMLAGLNFATRNLSSLGDLLMKDGYFVNRYNRGTLNRFGPNVVTGMVPVGAKGFLRGVGQVMSDLKNLSPRQAYRSWSNALQNITVLDAIDKTIAGIAYGAARSKLAREQGLTGEDLELAALALAGDSFRETQNASSPEDYSNFSRDYKGNDLVSSLFLFSSDRFAFLNSVAKSYRLAFTPGKRSEGVRGLASLLAVIPLEILVRQRYKAIAASMYALVGGEDDERRKFEKENKKDEQLLQLIVDQVVGISPILEQALSPITASIVPGMYRDDFLQLPVADTMSQMVRSVGRLADSIDKLSEDDLNATFSAVMVNIADLANRSSALVIGNPAYPVVNQVLRELREETSGSVSQVKGLNRYHKGLEQETLEEYSSEQRQYIVAIDRAVKDIRTLERRLRSIEKPLEEGRELSIENQRAVAAIKSQIREIADRALGLED